MYLESREGGASKFWSAKLEGKTLHVQWGRIGTSGQQQVKQFPSTEKAEAALQKLLAEKKSKGYVPARPGASSPRPPQKTARKASSPRARTAGAEELEDVCTAIEAFFQKLESVDGLEATPEELAPEKASDISAFEKKLGVTLPGEVQAFLRRGLRYASAFTRGDDSAHVGFDFIGLKSMAKTMQIYRGLTVHYEEDEEEERTELLLRGVPLSYSEPQLVVHCGPGRDAGAIYHLSTRNPVLPPVARSLTEFLRHWLAAGCFGSHDFQALWPLVEAHVPVKIPRKQNLWLRYYDRQFKTKYAR